MMDSDIFTQTWHNYKNRASGSENNWDTERGLNDQYAKFSDMDEHPNREQRSYSIDHNTDSHAQREPISVLPGGESSILNPDNKYNQDSTFGIGSDDMISRQKKSMDPRNKDPMIFKPPPPSTRKSISEDSGIGFFGDCITVSNAPRSRTSLDQQSLHRGFISTLPSAQGGRRRSSAIQRDVPLSDITNIVNNPRDESVSTSAYDNVPIGSSALKSNDMKLSTQSSSDDYNNFLVDRNDMSKSNSYYRSTTENRHELSDNSFDSELNNNDIPYSAKEVPSNFPSSRTEYAMKPKEKLNVSTGESTHDKDSLGQYAINTHEKTYVSPGVSGTKAIDKRTENLKGYQTDDSATEDEEETTGKGFFSYATSAAAAVGASAVAASAAVSNAFFGKPTNDNAIGTQRQVTESQRFSLDDSPSVWKSEDLSSGPNNLYETPIRWGKSTDSKAPPLSSYNKLADKQGAVLNNDQRNDVGDHQTDDFFSSFPDHKTKEEAIPHRAYVVPIQDAAISQGNSRLPAVPLKPIDRQKTSLSQETPTQRKAFTKSKTFAPQVPVSELSKEGSTICLAKNMPRPNKQSHVPYRHFDVPTREQAMLKDAIITPPPNESIEPEFVEDSPYNVLTKGQSILEKSTSDSPPPQELKKVTGILPNQLLYTSMPLPDPLKLDQEKPISRLEKLESIEGDTREKSVPLINNAVLSNVMPGSFVHSASEDHVSGFEHSNDEDEPAIHGQHACFHTMDIVPPEITPKQVDHSFCGNIKEPSIHGQNPSFYLDEDSNATGSIRDKSSIGGPVDNLNQDEAQTNDFESTNGIARELKRETLIPKNQGICQGISHDGVTYRDFANQGAYDPAISKANSNGLRNKGNPLRRYEQSQAPTTSLGSDEASNSGSSKDNGYVLGGNGPEYSKSPNYQSGYPSAKSAAGAAVAVGASVGASKLFAREKKTRATLNTSEPYNTQKLEPVSSKVKKQNEMLGFNKLEKESNESVSSTRATTGKIVPDAVYIKRNEDEVKPRATYNERLSGSIAKPLDNPPAVVEDYAVHPTSAPLINAAKLPPANKDYPAKVDQTVATSRPAGNVRRQSKGSIVMDKLRRLSLGGKRSSGSSNDIVIQEVRDRRPSAAEIYKNQQLNAQSENTNTSLKINTTKNQTETASGGFTSGQTTKPINIANEVPYYVEDPRLSSNGPQPQLDSNQKIARIPGINNMYPSGTKPLQPGKTVYVRLDDNHTTPQIRQVVVSQAEPLDKVTNIEQDVSRNAIASTGATGYVPGTNDGVSFGTYISGQLENRRGSIQKTVGKLVKNEDMQEKGDLKKVSGKIKMKAYQENRRSSSGSH